jgi:beta-xylosidase
MVKGILILFIFSVVCFWGRASNNDDGDFQGDIPSPAVRNCLKFNYDQLSNSKNNDQPNFSDDFNLPQLRSLWQSNLNECEWTLKERPGFLRIKAQKINTIDEFSQKNSFSQKVKYNTNGEAVCLIDLTNLLDKTNAGLYFSSKMMNYIGVETNEGAKTLLVSVNNQVYRGPTISENSVAFRIKIENSRGWFEYSFDGLNYVQLGAIFNLSALSKGNDCIGFYCYNRNSEIGSVDIDWFYFNPKKDNETKFAEAENIVLYPEL